MKVEKIDPKATGYKDNPVAYLYRMATPDHLCPFGLKSKHLLRSRGFYVDDNLLTSREETDDFKRKHDVETTPQTFIEGKRIGGYTDLRRHFGLAVPTEGATSYRPVIAVFVITALMAIMVSFTAFGTPYTPQSFVWFVTFSMCVLAILKLQDVERFSSMFLGYDLLARRWVPYGYIYPFAEAVAAILMIAGVLEWISVPIALFIGSVGAASVFKAVYIDKREIKCACVGGSSNVPLGFVSLTENLMMVTMGVWMALT